MTAPLGGPERIRGADARPARSPMTLRLVLAVFGLVVCLAAGGVVLLSPLPSGIGVALLVLGVVAAVDLAVVLRRKARGEPG